MWIEQVPIHHVPLSPETVISELQRVSGKFKNLLFSSFWNRPGLLFMLKNSGRCVPYHLPFSFSRDSLEVLTLLFV